MSHLYLLSALGATMVMYALTTLGAAMVFAVRRLRTEGLNVLMALGAGIMLAASYFSLLAPAIDSIGSAHDCLLIAFSFGIGGALVLGADYLMARGLRHVDGLPENKRRTALLIASITLHNIPEGLSVGCAFGALMVAAQSDMHSAWLLALGIALQNFPEGAAVSLPLHRDGFSRRRAFLFGQLTGAIEPVAGLLGAFLAMQVRHALPVLLSLAAGAMVAVILLELLPECQKSRYRRSLTLAVLLGFLLMMFLDTLPL